MVGVIRKQNTHARMVLYLLLVLQGGAIGACSFCAEQHRLKLCLSLLLEVTTARKHDPVRARGQGSWGRLHS